MPELLVDFITSLDGYGAAEGWPGWWGLQGPEYLACLGESPEANYTVLMGANTYRSCRDPDVALDMINSRTFDGRIQLLEYVPKVLTGPPGATRRTPETRPRAWLSMRLGLHW